MNIVVKGLHGRGALDTIYQIAATLEISLAEFFNHPIFDEVTD